MRKIFLLLFCVGLCAAPALAQQDSDPDLEKIKVDVSDGGAPSVAGELSALDDMSTPVKITLLLTALAILPAILMTVTAFTRIVIVLSFVRRALSIQDLPPNQIIVGLSLFLTLLVMSPVISDIYDDAVQPYMEEEIAFSEASDVALKRLHRFLLPHAHDEEIALFLDVTGSEVPENLSLIHI